MQMHVLSYQRAVYHFEVTYLLLWEAKTGAYVVSAPPSGFLALLYFSISD